MRTLPKQIHLLAVIALLCVAGSNVVVIRPAKALKASYTRVVLYSDRLSIPAARIAVRMQPETRKTVCPPGAGVEEQP